MLLNPVVSSLSLFFKQGSPIPNTQEYRNILGVLQYITTTRPDIAFSVNKVSQNSLTVHYILI